ncbi:MAG TPA: NAD(P)/FAD-dependent oxidoreductase [Bacteroidota bacterium]|nr:NAD(P)/FAD-dependent oxidoreductase [Bacteroidota bacterium]
MTPDVVIVGAGVVGLACAAESASRGLSTLLVERHESFGRETSSRNSEVVHSGIHYPPGSLKARLCVAANRNIYQTCEHDGVWIRRCGKLVVAVTPEEIPKLEEIFRRGEMNGVEGLRMLDAREALTLEPNIFCIAALLVPSAGIVDSHELMRSYIHHAKEHGVDIAFGVTLVGAEKTAAGFKLRLREAGGDTTDIECRCVVNAAGNSSDDVASFFGIDPDAAGYRLHPNRGHYFRVAPERGKLVSRLIYPVPPPRLTSIGIHITLDKGGQVKLGPDAEFLDPALPESEWYKFDESRENRFYEAVARYFPSLRREDLTPDQVGVRPKIQKPGEESRDFIIAEESSRGLPGLVNLIGIESPGLTCAAEIARMVFRQLL